MLKLWICKKIWVILSAMNKAEKAVSITFECSEWLRIFYNCQFCKKVKSSRTYNFEYLYLNYYQVCISWRTFTIPKILLTNHSVFWWMKWYRYINVLGCAGPTKGSSYIQLHLENHKVTIGRTSLLIRTWVRTHRRPATTCQVWGEASTLLRQVWESPGLEAS